MYKLQQTNKRFVKYCAWATGRIYIVSNKI